MEQKASWKTVLLWVMVCVSLVASIISPIITVVVFKKENDTVPAPQQSFNLDDAYVGYDNYLWLGDQRTNCVLPKQDDDNVFDNTLEITGDMSNYFSGGYVDISSSYVALMPYYKEAAKIALYSGLDISAITVYAKSNGNLAVGTAKISDIVAARLDGTALEVTNSNSYEVSKGKSEIRFQSPLHINEGETIVFGGNNSVSLYFVKNIPVDDEAGNFALLNQTKYENVIHASKDCTYNDTLAVKVVVETARRLPIFDSLKKDAFSDSQGDIAGSTLSSAQTYAYIDTSLFAGKRITRIDVPIIKITNPIDNRGVFTVSVFGNNPDELKGKPRRTYEFYIYTSALSKGEDQAVEINSWKTFDCDIQLAEDETLAFSSSQDNIVFGLSEESEPSKYAFSACGGGWSTESAMGSMFFDVYYAAEPLKFEDHVKTLDVLEENSQASQLEEKLRGKRLSVLGDSISTFDGYSNNTSYNSTIEDNAWYYSEEGAEFNRVEQTWWYKACEKTGMGLCVNNSFAGDKVTGGAKDRCVQLHDDALDELQTNEVYPDIIAIYVGINDFDSGCTLEKFKTDYDQMLSKIKNKYSNAQVFVFTFIPNNACKGRAITEMIEFNNVVKELAVKYSCGVVDLFADSGIDSSNLSQYMIDSPLLHPNEAGMEKMAECFLRALYKHYC